MSLPFLVSLATAVVALVLYANMSEEVPRMCALGIVAICFVLDLVLAPWPIQALILLFVLVRGKKSLPSSARS